MRIFIFLLLLSSNLFYSCQINDSEWEVKFCAEIKDKNCIGESIVFNKNVRVFVQLQCKNKIEEKKIIGSIYRMYNGEYTVFLGSKFFYPDGVKQIDHYIPFDELGGYGLHLIEFLDENRNIIISKELLIINE